MIYIDKPAQPIALDGGGDRIPIKQVLWDQRRQGESWLSLSPYQIRLHREDGLTSSPSSIRRGGGTHLPGRLKARVLLRLGGRLVIDVGDNVFHADTLQRLGIEARPGGSQPTHHFGTVSVTR